MVALRRRGLRPRSTMGAEKERKGGRERERTEEKRREIGLGVCLERGNPPGWPATLISVGSFALSSGGERESDRGEVAFNHSIANGSFLLVLLLLAGGEASDIRDIFQDGIRTGADARVCLSFCRLDVAKNKRRINTRRVSPREREDPISTSDRRPLCPFSRDFSRV